MEVGGLLPSSWPGGDHPSADREAHLGGDSPREARCLFIDNHAARQSLIKGYSPSLPSCRILGEAAMADARLECFSWYARVPSASIASDPASRLDYDRVRAVLPGAEWSEPVVPHAWWSAVGDSVAEWFL